MKYSIKIMAFSILSAAVISTSALALDLHEARAAGMVGELNTGYVKALKDNSEVQKLVEDINARRAQEYKRISAEKNQPVDVVAKLASGQIATNLESGAMYQDANGSWKKR